LKKSFTLLNTTLRTYKIDNQTLFNWAQELGIIIPRIAAKTAQASVIVLHQRFKALLNSFNITRTHPDWVRNTFAVVFCCFCVNLTYSYPAPLLCLLLLS